MFFYTLMSKDVNKLLEFRQNLHVYKLIVPSLRKIKILLHQVQYILQIRRMNKNIYNL